MEFLLFFHVFFKYIYVMIIQIIKIKSFIYFFSLKVMLYFLKYSDNDYRNFKEKKSAISFNLTEMKKIENYSI